MIKQSQLFLQTKLSSRSFFLSIEGLSAEFYLASNGWFGGRDDWGKWSHAPPHLSSLSLRDALDLGSWLRYLFTEALRQTGSAQSMDSIQTCAYARWHRQYEWVADLNMGTAWAPTKLLFIFSTLFIFCFLFPNLGRAVL